MFNQLKHFRKALHQLLPGLSSTLSIHIRTFGHLDSIRSDIQTLVPDQDGPPQVKATVSEMRVLGSECVHGANIVAGKVLPQMQRKSRQPRTQGLHPNSLTRPVSASLSIGKQLQRRDSSPRNATRRSVRNKRRSKRYKQRGNVRRRSCKQSKPNNKTCWRDVGSWKVKR